MGSRGRSIRLRIYFLVAIPLITMLGLFGYVAYTSTTNWLNLDRAPSLIKATSEPLTNFVNLLQAERRAAVVYESQPTAANLAAYQATVTATDRRHRRLRAGAQLAGHQEQRHRRRDRRHRLDDHRPQRHEPSCATRSLAKKLAPLDALAAYTNVIAGQDNVLQAEASSMTDAAASIAGPRPYLRRQHAGRPVRAGRGAGGRARGGSLTGPDRVAFGQAAGRQQDDTLLYQELLTPPSSRPTRT
jgi:hypothetical protein